jgi:uncharacterized protein YxeA
VALQMLGEAYMGVKKDTEDGAAEESEYVKIETKGSRTRESQQQHQRQQPSQQYPTDANGAEGRR